MRRTISRSCAVAALALVAVVVGRPGVAPKAYQTRAGRRRPSGRLTAPTGEHALLAARSDQQGQLLQARDRLAAEHERVRAAAGHRSTRPPRSSSATCSTRRSGTRSHGRRAQSGDRRGALDAQRRRRARGQNAARGGAGRGVAYWSSADGSDQRIIYVTPGYRMIALNAKTGAPISTFGQNGVVDLKLDNDQELDLVTADIGLNATPLVAGDVVVVGAAHRRRLAEDHEQRARATCADSMSRTGKRLWIFHTIPKPGEFGYDTWLETSAREKRQHRRMGANERRSRARPRLRPRRDADRATTTAATGPATRCSVRAWWRSTSRPASASGTTR